MTDYVEIFTERDFVDDVMTWGWQCFVCRDEEDGFGNASTAAEGRDNHAAICYPTTPAHPTPTQPQTVADDEETDHG